jgi:hypothetical protein
MLKQMPQTPILQRHLHMNLQVTPSLSPLSKGLPTTTTTTTCCGLHHNHTVLEPPSPTYTHADTRLAPHSHSSEQHRNTLADGSLTAPATPCPPPAAEDARASAATAAAVQRLRRREVLVPQAPAAPATLTTTAGLAGGGRLLSLTSHPSE